MARENALFQPTRRVQARRHSQHWGTAVVIGKEVQFLHVVHKQCCVAYKIPLQKSERQGLLLTLC